MITKHRVSLLLAMLAFQFISIGNQALAQDLKQTELDTSEATAFLGNWTLSMVMQDEPVEVEMIVDDVDGKLGAMVSVPQLPNALVATEAHLTDTGIDILFPVDFAGQTLNLTLSVQHKIVGVFADENGLISTEVEGVRLAGTSDAAPAPVALKASDLDTASMGSYIGAWDLAMSVGGRDTIITLQFIDVDGKAAALFVSPFNAEPANISNITLSEEGARLLFEADMLGQTVPVEVWITRLSETMEGNFSAMGGALKAEFLGERTDKDLLAKMTTVDENTRRRSRGGGTRQADLEIGANKIRVRYTAIKGDSPAYNVLGSLEADSVFTYSEGRTIKLLSDADLVFGDTLLKTENAAANYPGVYGLWLKKTDTGWSLVANEDTDILGSQYDPSANITEFPVTVSDSGEEAGGPMEVVLEENESGGVLKILWGTRVWSAPFTIGENSIAKASD